MSSGDLDLLTPEMREKVDRLRESLSFKTLVLCTVRPATDQAILWRRGRSLGKIQSKIKWLERYNEELARILHDVGPQQGKKIATKVGPGESWHQYREAIDLVPIIGGKIPWSGANEEWLEYGKKCLEVGLVWGGNWSFKDLAHAQLPLTGNPLKLGVKGCVMY